MRNLVSQIQCLMSFLIVAESEEENEIVFFNGQ